MQRPTTSAITLLLLFGFGLTCIAQSDLIDGSKHPEMISDTTAYRLFLATYSGTDQVHRGRQAALFNAMQLPQQDRPVFAVMLDSFGVRFQQILLDDAKDVAANPDTDHTTFFVNRDAMMDDILQSLKLQLSSLGFTRLNTYVQREKRNMRISAELERRRP